MLSSEMPKSFLHAGVEIGNFACGNGMSGTAITELDEEISAVATAAALAIVEFNATCAVQGDARASIKASAFASARAVAYAEAVSNVFSSKNVCTNCTAAVDALVRTSRQVVADAFADNDLRVRRTVPCYSFVTTLRRSAGVTHTHTHTHAWATCIIQSHKFSLWGAIVNTAQRVGLHGPKLLRPFSFCCSLSLIRDRTAHCELTMSV